MAKLCRLCLKPVDNFNYTIIKNQQICSDSVIKKLNICVPEMNLDLVKDTLMCNCCAITLDSLHYFKSSCLESERRIRDFMKQANISDALCDLNESQFIKHRSTLKQENVEDEMKAPIIITDESEMEQSFDETDSQDPFASCAEECDTAALIKDEIHIKEETLNMEESMDEQQLLPPSLQWEDDVIDEEYSSDESHIDENDQLEFVDFNESCSDIDDDMLLEEVVQYPTKNTNTDPVNIKSKVGGEESTDLPLHYYGKDGCFVWNSFEPTCAKTTTNHNSAKIKLSALQEVSKSLNNTSSSEDIWRLLFDETIINEIVLYTNQKLQKLREKVQGKQSLYYKDTDPVEVEALIGVLMLCSIFKSDKQDLLSLFSSGVGSPPIFREIMSLKRCQSLLMALRFSDAASRRTTNETDRTAAVSFIFNRFISNSQNNYVIGNCVCVGEMLLEFRGTCPIRTCIPKKTARRSIKIMCLTDAKTSYLYNAYIYTGTDTGDILLAEPTQAVLRLVRPVVNSNRTVIADNRFSSLEVLEELRSRGLTYVGTIKKNKRVIPPEFISCKERDVGSSMYGFTDNFTLLSYVPRKNKPVVLVSSMHHSNLTDVSNNKPQMVSFYNSTKSGVDTLEKTIANYSPTRRIRRWPLTIFYNMVAVSCANSKVIFAAIHKNKNETIYSFTYNLATSLIRRHVDRRPKIPADPPSDLNNIVAQIIEPNSLEQTKNHEARTDKLEKRKTCRYCPSKRRRMTAYKCLLCSSPTCLECSKKVCNTCCNDL